MRFVLNGCDISFIAEAPEDITLKQLIKQADRIEPDWCACGVCSLEHEYENGGADLETEIIFSYDDVWKANEQVCCQIKARRARNDQRQADEMDKEKAGYCFAK